MWMTEWLRNNDEVVEIAKYLYYQIMWGYSITA